MTGLYRINAKPHAWREERPALLAAASRASCYGSYRTLVLSERGLERINSESQPFPLVQVKPHGTNRLRGRIYLAGGVVEVVVDPGQVSEWVLR